MIMIGYFFSLSQSFFNQLLEVKGFVAYKALVYALGLPLSGLYNVYLVEMPSIQTFIFVMLSFWLLSHVIMNLLYYQILKINMWYFFAKTYTFIIMQVLISMFFTIKIVSQELDLWSFIGAGLLYSCIFWGLDFLSKKFISYRQLVK